MSYVWPAGLEPLRNWLKVQGVDVKSIVSERQAAFYVQKLSDQRLKFPTDRSASHFPLLKKLQDIICTGAVTPRPVPTRGQPFQHKKKAKPKHTKQHEMPADALVIYCDGCCEPNPGAGGWGFAVYRQGVEIDARCGGTATATNNTMELTGLLHALAWVAAIAPAEPVVIFCDSQYVVKGLNEWVPGWKAKGWKRKGQNANEKNQTIANLPLWQTIDRARDELQFVKVEWVKGHVGTSGNERADELAGQGRSEALPVEPPSSLDMIRQQLDYSTRG
ncbi:ribonuclease HI [Mesorhizobium sp. B2-5-9]|uniref:ribonuclease H family protein n=1 Tax=Mesorhizobium sp. B2-5-9 TaxID=2589921 RepID=UPI0011277879|nr:ribonuclease H [Mesorhizobium sp. B2-5-9]TPK16679.1 ribonuclease HI [Mesorhizobium sp. B2-5-9]